MEGPDLARDVAISVFIGGVFGSQIAYDVFDILPRDKVYDFLLEEFPKDFKQNIIDGVDMRDFFAELTQINKKARDKWRTEFEAEILSHVNEKGFFVSHY